LRRMAVPHIGHSLDPGMVLVTVTPAGCLDKRGTGSYR
jgi:hypothetical protein